MACPTCVVFTGVNGAGKSTFYRAGRRRSADMPQSMVRVNPDELLRDEGAACRWLAAAMADEQVWRR